MLFVILRGLIQAIALNLGVLPMIVRRALHSYIVVVIALSRCCQVFLRPLIVSRLEARSLVVQARPRFRSFRISSVADSQE